MQFKHPSDNNNDEVAVVVNRNDLSEVVEAPRDLIIQAETPTQLAPIVEKKKRVKTTTARAQKNTTKQAAYSNRVGNIEVVLKKPKRNNVMSAGSTMKSQETINFEELEASYGHKADKSMLMQKLEEMA